MINKTEETVVKESLAATALEHFPDFPAKAMKRMRFLADQRGIELDILEARETIEAIIAERETEAASKLTVRQKIRNSLTVGRR